MKDFIIKYWLEVLFGIVVMLLTAAVKRLFKKLKEEKEDYESIKYGMLSLLRAELIRSGEKYLEQGWISIYARDAFEKAYSAYHGLGGNGTITKLYEDVMELPIINPSKKEC